MLYKIMMLAAAGALGTLSRYSLAGVVQKIAGSDFPYGTMVVNIIGCFAAGMLWSLFEGRINVSNEFRIIILVGFMGAFTTFSTFILETSELFRTAQLAAAFGNLLLQNSLGFICMYLGITIGRLA